MFRVMLRSAREDAGISQNEAARRLGIPQTRLWAVEAGIRRLDVLEFLDLARVLEVDASDLIARFKAALDALAKPT